jgi:hypothetical protein
MNNTKSLLTLLFTTLTLLLHFDVAIAIEINPTDQYTPASSENTSTFTIADISEKDNDNLGLGIAGQDSNATNTYLSTESGSMDSSAKKGAYNRPINDKASNTQQLPEQIFQSSANSAPADLISFNDQQLNESIAADWQGFKGKVKAAKSTIETALSFSPGEFQNHANMADYRPNQPNHRSSNWNAGTTNESIDESQVPGYYRLLYLIINARHEHPLVFYSVIFFIAFFVIIKTVLITASRFR